MDDSKKTITIVTVTYNAQAVLEKTIKSIIKQIDNDVEYIVVDGNSNDGTLRIINKYIDKVSKLISEPDDGIYDAMNKGIKNAKGEYILFVNAGDILCGDVIMKILPRLKSGNIDMLYGNVVNIYKDKSEVYAGEFNVFKIVKKNICQQAIFYNRKKLLELGMFQLKYKIYADWIMNMQFFSRKYENVYMDICVCEYDMYGISNQTIDNEFIADVDDFVYDNFSHMVYIYYCVRKRLVRKVKEMCKGKIVKNIGSFFEWRL